jgi:hypothetical protein
LVLRNAISNPALLLRVILQLPILAWWWHLFPYTIHISMGNVPGKENKAHKHFSLRFAKLPPQMHKYFTTYMRSWNVEELLLRPLGLWVEPEETKLIWKSNKSNALFQEKQSISLIT